MATMIVDIPDDVVAREGLNEAAIRIEVACRLFDAQKLSKGEACRLAGLSRLEFENALIGRDLPVLRYTQEMFNEDMATLKNLEIPTMSASKPR